MLVQRAVLGTIAAALAGCVPAGVEEPPPDDSPCSIDLLSAEALDGAVHVAPGGDGDGSAESPMGDLQAAADAGAGVIAVAAGTYTGGLVLGDAHDGLRIVGSCSDTVRIELPGADGAGISVDGADVLLAGLTLAAPEGDGIVIDSGEVTLQDIVIDGWFGHGVLATGPEAQLVIDGVAMRDGEGEDQANGGGAIRLLDGATATGGPLRIDNTYAYGFYARGEGTFADLHDVTAVGCQSPRAGLAGASCVLSRSGASVRIVGGRLEAAMGSAAYVLEASLELEDVDVVDTRVASDGYSAGALLNISGSLTVTRGTITDSHATAVYVADPGAEAVLTGVVIEGVRADALTTNGYGVRLESLPNVVGEDDRPRATLQDVTITDTDGSGVSTDLRARPILHLEGVDISNANADGRIAGAGVAVLSGSLDASGLHVHDSLHAGLVVAEAGTVATVENSTFERLDGGPGLTAVGVFAYDGSDVTLIDCTMRDIASIGVYALGGARILVSGGEVSGQVASDDTTLGRGIHAEGAGRIEAVDVALIANDGPGVVTSAAGIISVTGGRISDNRAAGVFANSGILELIDVEIEDNVAHDSEGGGFGVYVENTFEVDVLLDGVEIRGSPDAALVLNNPAAGGPETASAQVIDTLIEGSEADNSDPFLATSGDAVRICGGFEPWDGMAGLRISGVEITDAGRVGLLLHESGATIEDGTTFSGNGVPAAQQPCASVDGSLDGVPGALNCADLPFEFVVDCDGVEFADELPTAVGR